jgi:hypothetical protein
MLVKRTGPLAPPVMIIPSDKDILNYRLDIRKIQFQTQLLIERLQMIQKNFLLEFNIIGYI